MSNLQIPKTPGGLPSAVRQWFDAVGSTLKVFLGKGSSGFPTRGELARTGVIGIGGDGTATTPTTPTGDVTVPPPITGLAAEGALASIFLSWDAPAFRNLAYVEILRADTDDFGSAFPIGSAVSGVNMYKDNVGSGATKYYWVRSVTKSGVKGPVNATAGTKGNTGYDPSYVMEILTSGIWQAGHLYEPYQYVRPTAASNYQYVCVSGGTSGATEPTWPTTVGATVTDGSCTWACEALSSRIPFAIGTVDGQPAVSILNAFIQDASITNAKVHDMAVDKLTAGTIAAIAIRLGGYLWNGFSNFSNPLDVAGFWFGMSGSTPRFKLTTGAAGGDQGITFDGTNLTVTGDGTFNDVFGHNARFNVVSATNLLYVNRCVESDFISAHSITIDNPEYNKYLCLTDKIIRNGSSSPLFIGQIHFNSTWHIPYGNEGYFSDPMITAFAGGIHPYDYADTATVLRFKAPGPRVRIVLECNSFTEAANIKIFSWALSSLMLTIQNTDQALAGTGFAFDLKSYMETIADTTDPTAYVFTATSTSGYSVSITAWSDYSKKRIYLDCADADNAFRYSDGGYNALRSKLMLTPIAGPSGSITTIPLTCVLYTEVIKDQYDPIATIVSDPAL